MIDVGLPTELADPVARTLERARAENVAGRIWSKDATLWAPGGQADEITNRLGWLDIASRTSALLGELGEFVEGVRADGFTDCVLLGMGGSSLAPEVFQLTFEPAGLRLHVLDTTDPVTVAAVTERLDLNKTLFVYSSKSGGTIEPNSLFRHFWGLLPDGSHYVAITDPGTALGKLAAENGFRKVWVNDPDIGGRYSALSWFGIVPAALAGVDVAALLAPAVAAESANGADLPDGPAVRLGATVGALARAGRDKLTFILEPPLASFGLWVEQLVAESTGKHGRGILPVADEPLVEPEHYGSDRVFVYIRDPEAAEGSSAAAVAALAATHPVITIDSTAARIGELMYVWEFAIAVAGWVLELNPFDQPNVQEAKDNTNAVLESGRPELKDGSLGDILDSSLAPPAYVAIMGYLPYDAATDAAVARLRAALLRRYGVATTWGYGPRFLHSTGQYHKGGPRRGRFLQLTHDGGIDVAVPGRPFGLRALIDAQADGDLKTLREHELPAVRVRVDGADTGGSIDALSAGP